MSEPAVEDAEGRDSTPPPARPSYRGAAIALAAALILLVALAGTAPFWAPALPWSPPPAADPRIETIEHALQQVRQDAAAAAEERKQLARRVAALAAKPAPPAADTADLRQQIAKLATGEADLTAQVAALGKTVESQRQAGDDLAQRVAALDEARQTQVKAGAELKSRVDALDKTAQREGASGSGDTAILLALLQIETALQSGRPFAAEYDALIAAARGRPKIIAAAAPLAAAAKTGVAGQAALAEQLRRLGPAIAKATAPEPEAAAGWGEELLVRLRGLVRVRRIDATGPAPDDTTAAVGAAERGLAGGDLETAVAAIEKLRGGAADAARPWLGRAKERLAAERAVQQIEAALAADLGAAKPPADTGSAR